MTKTTVNDQVREIAYLQRQVADLLDAAGRNHETTRAVGRLEREPEADERPEGEWEEHAVFGRQIRRSENAPPVLDHP